MSHEEMHDASNSLGSRLREISKLEFARKFVEERKLGHGGGGYVFLSTHPTFGHVAVKRIEHHHHVGREIEILRRLGESCPYVTPMLDGFEVNGTKYLVFPFYRKGDLCDLLCEVIDKGISLDQEFVRNTMKKLFEAVLYLHQHNIVHRDIKDQNILIDDDGNPRLCDFGLARFIGKKKIQNRRLTYGVGTLPYQPPEMLAHDGVYSKAVDLWSCGVVFYQLLTGLYPFNSYDEDYENYPDNISSIQIDVINQHIGSKARGLQEKFNEFRIPYRARDLLSRLLEVDEDKRITAEDALNHSYFKLRALKR